MLWVKSFHLFFVMSWFAGIFYLPRIFVNLAMTRDQNADTHQHLLLMARKLYRFMNPLMILSVILGIWLILTNPDYYLTAIWLHIKITLVVLLLIFHWLCGWFLRQFEAGNCKKSHVYFRFYNEAPVFILLAILILVVVKPI